jgi:hypothetical protein
MSRICQIDCHGRHAVPVEPKSPAAVSAKPEYLRVQPETFGHLVAREGKKAVWRRKSNRENAAVCGPFAPSRVVIPIRWTAWLGREDSNLQVSKAMRDRFSSSPIGNETCYPRGLPNPFPLALCENLERDEFWKPYRMGKVQRFGDKQTFRRTILRLCRLEVRSSK